MERARNEAPRSRLILLTLLGVAAVGCRLPDASDVRESGGDAYGTVCHDATDCFVPKHLVIYCQGLGACDPSERERLATDWLDRVVRGPSRSGARLELWVERQSGGSAELLVAAQVPSRWGGQVAQKKAAFRKKLEGALSAKEIEPVRIGAAGAIQPGEAFEVHLVDRGGRQRWRVYSEPVHWVVVCDLSESTRRACGVEQLAAAARRWLQRGGVTAGSTWSVLVPGKGRASATWVARVRVRGDAPVGHRIAELRAELRERTSPEAFETMVQRSERGSAILEAISVALEELASRRGPKRLVIISDLRQRSAGRWRFERAVPRPERFVAWARREGLLESAGKVRLERVCGVHHLAAPGSRFTARDAKRLRVLWRAVFRQLGWSDVPIASICDD